jgi:hypothetical protein
MLVSEAFRLFPGLSPIHIQCTFVQQSAIQSSDRFVSVFCAGHLHKAEPAWLAGVAVHHDPEGADFGAEEQIDGRSWEAGASEQLNAVKV